MKTKQVENKPLTPEEIEEFNEYLAVRLKKHVIFREKIRGISADIIQQLGEIILRELAQHKIKVTENQIGVGVDDNGYIVNFRVNKRSKYNLNLIVIHWMGGITVSNREHDHLGIIDAIVPLLEKLFDPTVLGGSYSNEED